MGLKSTTVKLYSLICQELCLSKIILFFYDLGTLNDLNYYNTWFGPFVVIVLQQQDMIF